MNRTPTSAHLSLVTLLLASGCGDGGDTADKLEQESSAHLDVCMKAYQLVEEDCHEVLCAEAEPLTCSYGDVSVDGDDCGCRTEWMLYTQLCEDRSTDSLETVQAGLVCE